ncbi:MAG: S41 family peptidase, partial [Chitinophagales bacterium]|nr:S41 family peptidase [Chitinophagales bacterium]
SEILSGAIQDWDRGTVVGRTSFGKGLVQEQFPLSDGSALRLTVARYYTPSGRCIQRPYHNGKAAYQDEFFKRYENGSLLREDTLQPTDSLVFKTAKGRIVYGGGGIRPDIFTPFDSAVLSATFVEAVSHIPEFTYKNYPAYDAQISAYRSVEEYHRRFEISDELLKKYFDFLKQQNPKADPAKYKQYDKKIKHRIKAFFARQRWHNEGYYYVMKDEDSDIKKALEVIRNDAIANR